MLEALTFHIQDVNMQVKKKKVKKERGEAQIL